jgi:hypothetical protein
VRTPPILYGFAVGYMIVISLISGFGALLGLFASLTAWSSPTNNPIPILTWILLVVTVGPMLGFAWEYIKTLE